MGVWLRVAPMVQAKTWRKAPVVLIGPVLAPGNRTVRAARRVMGLKDEGRSAP